MNNATFTSAIVLVLVGVGCAARVAYVSPPSAPFEDERVIITASGERLCALHESPLVTVDGFEAGPGVMIDPSAEARRAAGYYPNYIPVRCSLNSNSCYSASCKISYCPKCNEEMTRAMLAATRQRQTGRTREEGK